MKERRKYKRRISPHGSKHISLNGRFEFVSNKEYRKSIMAKSKTYKRREPMKGPAPRRPDSATGLTRNQILAIIVGVLICVSMVLALIVIPGSHGGL